MKVVLLSGGADSAVLLYTIGPVHGRDVCALAVDYGQMHAHELLCARVLAARLDVAFAVRQLKLWGGAHYLRGAQEGLTPNLPEAFLPARNIALITAALAMGATEIYFGATKTDAQFPDCSRPFFEALEAAATAGGTPVTIHTPFIDMPKTEVIRQGLELGVPFELTHSCYKPRHGMTGTTIACGECAACQHRLQAFEVLGHTDPAVYSC